jgi:hypothetical protein
VSRLVDLSQEITAERAGEQPQHDALDQRIHGMGLGGGQHHAQARIERGRAHGARERGVGDVPHRLYGVLDAADVCAAGRWCALALTEIRAAHEAGRLPVLVGGTGLYLKALIEGIAPTPAVPAEIPPR